MILLIDLRLSDNESHNIVKLHFPAQSTIEQLQDEVLASFRIAIKYQQLYDSENRRIDLLVGSLEGVGLKDSETLILKHALLDNWNTYLSFCGAVMDTNKTKAGRISCAHRAIAQSKGLEDSGFFEVFPKVGKRWSDLLDEMIRFVDCTQNVFKQSATAFFSEMYPGSQIGFQQKAEGTRPGIVVNVSWEEKETVYYMKCYHHAGTSLALSRTKRHLPDLREMLAYRLLNLIGVGPTVYFPYYHGSTHVHYIATEQVSEFKKLELIEDLTVQKQIVVKAYLLQLILGIRDLNEGNIGSSTDNMLSIVDFYVPDSVTFLQSQIFLDFQNKSHFGGVGPASEILHEIGKDERIAIAREAVPQWSRINDLGIDIIGKEKEELREHGIKFGNATDDVNKYLEEVKTNYALFCSAL